MFDDYRLPYPCYADPRNGYAARILLPNLLVVLFAPDPMPYPDFLDWPERVWASTLANACGAVWQGLATEGDAGIAQAPLPIPASDGTVAFLLTPLPPILTPDAPEGRLPFWSATSGDGTPVPELALRVRAWLDRERINLHLKPDLARRAADAATAALRPLLPTAEMQEAFRANALRTWTPSDGSIDGSHTEEPELADGRDMLLWAPYQWHDNNRMPFGMIATDGDLDPEWNAIFQDAIRAALS